MHDEEQFLSVAAQARKDAMLPDLLGAVRGRRRRRQAGYAAGAGAAIALLAWLAQMLVQGGRDVGDLDRDGLVHAPSPVVCEVVRDVPGIVARCQVSSTVRPEWFARVGDDAEWLAQRLVDDGQLQNFLRESERPFGLLEVAGKTLVASAAMDPFPTKVAE